jgi:hypothetical protein
MAVFYLLPSRMDLERSLAEFLEAVLPGLPLTDESLYGLSDLIQERLTRRADVYVVFREELPTDLDLFEALRDGFGATPDDDIIELRINQAPGLGFRSRRMDAVSAA